MTNTMNLMTLSTVLLLTGCQSIQSFDGETGYQRINSNPAQVIISYTLDAKASQAMIQQKLQRACARELGLASSTAVELQIMDQQEIVNPKTLASNRITSDVYLGQQDKTSFGLSSTPKLSNNSNNANLDMLNNKPNTLKQITAECLN